MTDSEYHLIEAKIEQGGIVTWGEVRTLLDSYRRARAELAILRPAGRAVLAFAVGEYGTNSGMMVERCADTLIAAGWTGEPIP